MLNTAANEYRNLPLSLLTESTSNPRRRFEDGPLQELAQSIRVQGVLSPLLVRPLTEQSFEIVAGGEAAFVPRSWPKRRPFPSASSTSPMPKHWRLN